MLKLFGALLVLGSSAGLGVSIGLDAKKRLMELKCLKQMMYMLRGEMKYTKNPLPEAFASMCERLGPPFSDFLQAVSEELNLRNGKSLETIWQEKAGLLWGKTHFLKKDQERFLRLAEGLGYLDQEMQLAHIDFFVEELELEIKSSHEALGNRLRLCNCLGVMGGVFLLIVML